MESSPHTPHQVFVGRETEILQIRRHAERAASGTTQLVIVEGDLGAGKTTLVRRALDPLHDFVHVPVILFEPDQQHQGYLGRYVLRGSENFDTLGVEELAAFGASTVARVKHPTIVCVDNFQWADRTSAEALWLGLRQLDQHPVLVLLTMRPNAREELSRLVGLAQSGPNASHLTIGELSVQQIHEVLTCAAGLPISEAAAHRVREETDGVPALVTDIAERLSATGPYPGRSIDEVLEAHRLELRRPTNTFRHHVLGRIASFSAEAREILELLAVARCPLSGRDIGNALDREPTGLNELTESEVTVYDAAAFGYRLKHPSWRNPIMGSLNPEQEGMLHQALSRRGTGLWHLEHRMVAARLTGSEERCTQELVQAALEQVQERSHHDDPSTALELLRTCLLLHPTPSGVEAFFRLALSTGMVHQLRDGSLERAFRHHSQGIRRSSLLALVSMGRGDLNSAVRRLERFEDVHGISSEDLALYTCAVVEAGRQSVMYGVLGIDGDLFARTHRALAERERDAAAARNRHLPLPDPGGLRVLLDTWTVLSNGSGPRHLSYDTPPTQSALSTPGEEDTGIHASDPEGAATALNAARSVVEDHVTTELAPTALRAITGAQLRAVGACRDAFQELEAVSRRSSRYAQDYVNFGRQHFVLSLFYAGLWDEARHVAFQTAQHGLDQGEDPEALIAYAFAALVPAARGEEIGQRMLKAVAHAETLGHSTTVKSFLAYVESWVSVVREDHGRTAEIMLKLKDSDFAWQTVGLLPTTVLSRAMHYSGRGESLPTMLDIIHDERISALPEIRSYAAEHLRGLMSHDPDESFGHLAEALSWLDRTSPHQVSIIAADRGAFRLHRGLLALDIGEVITAHPHPSHTQRDQTTDLLLWAKEFFSQCGAGTLTAHVSSLQERLQTPTEWVRGQGPHPLGHASSDRFLRSLTRREKEIVGMVAEGMTNREIAEELVLSVRTVETHVRNILSKLEIPSRRELYRELTRDVAHGLNSLRSWRN